MVVHDRHRTDNSLPRRRVHVAPTHSIAQFLHSCIRPAIFFKLKLKYFLLCNNIATYCEETTTYLIVVVVVIVIHMMICCNVGGRGRVPE